METQYGDGRSKELFTVQRGAGTSHDSGPGELSYRLLGSKTGLEPRGLDARSQFATYWLI